METKVEIHHNRLIHLDDSMVRYGAYNAEKLERLIKTMHQIHNLSTAFTWYVSKMEFITMA